MTCRLAGQTGTFPIAADDPSYACDSNPGTIMDTAISVSVASLGVAATVEAVEFEVRELVPRRHTDPATHRAVVRRLVEEVVADYDERILTSATSTTANS